MYSRVQIKNKQEHPTADAIQVFKNVQGLLSDHMHFIKLKLTWGKIKSIKRHFRFLTGSHRFQDFYY